MVWRDYQLVDSSELTTELLENREGITIIERCIGMAINAETGDGVILKLSVKLRLVYCLSDRWLLYPV